MYERSQQRFDHIYLELLPPSSHLCLILPIEKFDELYTTYVNHHHFWFIIQHIDQNLLQTYVNMIQFHKQNIPHQRIEGIVIILNASECQHFELSITWDHIRRMSQQLQIQLHCLVQVHEVNVPFHLYDLEDMSLNLPLLSTFNKFLIYFTGKMDGFQIAKRTMHRLFQLGVPNVNVIFPYFEQAIAPVQKWNLGGLLYTRYDIRSHTPCLCWMKHLERAPFEKYGTHLQQHPKPPHTSHMRSHSMSYYQTEMNLKQTPVMIPAKENTQRKGKVPPPKNNRPTSQQNYKRKEPAVKMNEHQQKRFPGGEVSNTLQNPAQPVQLLSKPKSVCVTICPPLTTEPKEKPKP